MTDSTYADTEELRTRSRAGSILACLNTPDGSRVDAFRDLTADQCDDVIRWADRETAPTMASVNSIFARMFGEARA